MKKPYCDNCQMVEYSNYDRPPYIKGGFHGGYPNMWHHPGGIKPIPPFTYGPFVPGLYGPYMQNAFGPNWLAILLALNALGPRDNKRYEEFLEQRGMYL
ncbi:MAG: hypothetical protein N2749_01830 [Clostridia bacterium]|nr:hypothetical protein [Clostridia bacterium]